MHLIELVAIAIHDMAGSLFASYHPDGEPGKNKTDFACLSRITYCRVGHYPRGPYDAVGYWAESHIFGGVVVFDRGPDEGARKVSSSLYIVYHIRPQRS
jgi:hypothetical protein